MNKHSTQTGERGFVALLTSILISMLLIVIVLSMVSIEGLQLRKADDAEQSLRAYYTAESGVEAGVATVLSDQATGTALPGPGCTASANFDTTHGGSEWTCQQFSFSGSPSGDLSQPDVAATVDPGGGVAYQSVIVEWGDKTSNPNGYYNVPLATGFPDQAGYTYEPTMELTVVQYPKVPFAPGDPNLKLQNAVFVPAGNGAAGTANYVAGGGLAGHGPFPANCGPLPHADPVGGNNQNCYVILQNLPPGFNYIFRVRTRYARASYQLNFMSSPTGGGGPGNIVQVPDGLATIDVTAQAGQTYRRVISQLPLNSTGGDQLNYVMYSDTRICKDFDVINDLAVNPYPCP